MVLHHSGLKVGVLMTLHPVMKIRMNPKKKISVTGSD